MLGPGDSVIAAVSGGPDSVCLLHVLLAVAPRIGFRVAGAAHLNHKLRGEASEEDARFVERMAKGLGVPYFGAAEDCSAVEGNLEEAARVARLRFFRRLIQDVCGTHVATGHTRDDQAETVLFRLLRGSGLAGLSGILPVTRERLIRPLLDVTRAEVLGYLNRAQIPSRQDETNKDFSFARNRIRHELLPQLAKDWNPEIHNALARLAELAFDEESWWAAEIERAAEQILVPALGGVEFDAARVAALPRALARRLIRHAAVRVLNRPASLDFEHVEKVLQLAAQPEGEGGLAVPGLAVSRSLDWVRLAPLGVGPATEPVPVSGPGVYDWPLGGRRIHLELDETKSTEVAEEGCDTLRVDRFRKPLGFELRGWMPGDSYRPCGSPHRKKLADLFQEARVPSWKRRNWPILTDGAEILWAAGFGAAEGDSRSGPVIRIRTENLEV